MVYFGMTTPSGTNPHSKRTSDIDLPAGNEIMHISDAEEKRPLLLEREKVHFPDFSTILPIYRYFDLDSAIFITHDLTPQYILDTGRQQVETLTKLILKTDLSGEILTYLNEAYAYLSEEDSPKKSDYIYVFGAKTPFRIHKAIELYRQGLAPKLILSGKGPFYGDDTETEAERYAALAVQAGILTQNLIIEDASITIPDNVRRTLNMLDSTKTPYASFILVNSPYTQRRGWCSWKKHLPNGIKIYRVNCETGPQFAPNSWYTNESGLKVILGEFIGLRNTMAFNDA